jgi:hypothetical protein
VDIAAWLRGLGLAEYEPTFRENAVDSAVLPNLTSEDLKDLGVTLVGHRRRLLDAIVALRAEPVARPRTDSAASAPERRQLTVLFCGFCHPAEGGGRTFLNPATDAAHLRQYDR